MADDSRTEQSTPRHNDPNDAVGVGSDSLHLGRSLGGHFEAAPPGSRPGAARHCPDLQVSPNNNDCLTWHASCEKIFWIGQIPSLSLTLAVRFRQKINRCQEIMTPKHLVIAQELLGLGPAAMAHALGISSETFSEWQSGRQAVPKKVVRRKWLDD